MAYEEWTYHGIAVSDDDEDGEWEPARLLVERPEKGPTQRQMNGTVLRELSNGEDSDFGWGHNGGGTSRTAAAVLTDALELGEDSGIEFAAWPQDETLEALREAFCVDVLTQMCAEWRLGRGAVLRWVLAWYIQRGEEPPALLRELPPVEDYTA